MDVQISLLKWRMAEQGAVETSVANNIVSVPAQLMLLPPPLPDDSRASVHMRVQAQDIIAHIQQ